MNRRDFIRNGSLAGAAILLPSARTLAGLGEAADCQAVVSNLSAYSRRVLPMVNGDEVHVLASIDSLAAFADPEVRCRALPYPGMQSHGNVLSFAYRDTRYRIENVMPEQFNDRAQELRSIHHA